MIFNSLTFLLFLLIVYSLYWLLDRRRQNLLLLIAGYVFYGWWDWRFLSLIVITSAIDYSIGWRIGKAEGERRRKFLLWITLAANLGMLGFFKYYNFFAESLVEALASIGWSASGSTLNVVLPVGLSFYTFQSMSYALDVYRRKCAPHRDIVEYFAFVAFFPQMVAGPIERATHLLGQFSQDRRFDVEKAKDGLRQMLSGFIKKVVIADGLAGYVNSVYAHPDDGNGAQLLLATYFFAFQIYCDFSGYSDIAIGCARLLGFDLTRNFAVPYFSRNIREFWRRWHISLSSWLRDYVYIPLGGSRVALKQVILNTAITFGLCGLWHGARWTFVAWGILNGLYFIPSILRWHGRKEERPAAAGEATLKDLPSILFTFHIVLFAWVLFRAHSLDEAGRILESMWSGFDVQILLREAVKLKLMILLLLAVEWIQRGKEHPLDVRHMPMWARWCVYNAAALAIILCGTFDYQPFIYFQF